MDTRMIGNIQRTMRYKADVLAGEGDIILQLVISRTAALIKGTRYRCKFRLSAAFAVVGIPRNEIPGGKNSLSIVIECLFLEHNCAFTS